MIVGEESPEHIADIIYSALDRNGNGCVSVSKVLEYIQNEIPNSEICNSLPLCDLEKMLTAHERKYIDRLELISVMKIWTEKIEQDAKSELLKPVTLADCNPSALLLEELPLCECGPLNVSTHSSDSPERITKREYNDMVAKLASISQIKRGLEEENFSLQALLKEHEENYNLLIVENEQLKKTLTVHEKKLEDFQNLQQEYLETNCAFQMAESNNRELKLKLQQSEKICANLQQKLDEIVEQKCEVVTALEKAGNSLTECRKELSAQKEAYESLRLKYEADKHMLLERISTLEDMITVLESKNKILNEIKSELELKVASMLEESTNVNNSWRSFLSDSSSGSSICLQSQGGYCHQFCSTESVEIYRKTLYAELQASGDLCLTHKQLEQQLREWQEKAMKYREELDEYKENEKVAKEIAKSVVQHLELYGAQEQQPTKEQTCLQYTGNDMVMDKAPERSGGEEPKPSTELFCLQYAGIDTIVDKAPERSGAEEPNPSTELSCLQYAGNDTIVDKAPESCGAQESKLSVKQTCCQPAVNDTFVEKAPGRTFHYELLQHTKMFLKAAVSFKNLRRMFTLAVSLLLIFVIGSSFLNLFVDCCFYSHTIYGTLCSVMEDVFRPYVTLRHFSPPPT